LTVCNGTSSFNTLPTEPPGIIAEQDSEMVARERRLWARR
jgi:hypothetical protein